jgi:hypothetical protein
MKKRKLIILFAAIVTAVVSMTGLSVMFSQAATPKYFDAASISVTEAGYGNTYLTSNQVTAQLSDGTYYTDKVIYYTEAARPSEIVLKLSGIDGVTPYYTVAGGAETLFSDRAVIPVNSPTVAIQLIFKNNALVNQRMNITISFRQEDSDEIFDGGRGTVEDPYIVSEARHLDNIRFFMNSHFEIADDIDLGDYRNRPNELEADYAADNKWRTIGYGDIDVFGGSITGPVDGFGVPLYTVSGLNVTNGGLIRITEGATVGGFGLSDFRFYSTAATSQSGLLVRTATDTRFKDIYLLDGFTQVSSQHTGLLAQTANYTQGFDTSVPAGENIVSHVGIKAANATGVNDASAFLGGLFDTLTGVKVGGNYPTFTGITVEGDFAASRAVGGMAAYASGVITESYTFIGTIGLGSTGYQNASGAVYGQSAGAHIGDNIDVNVSIYNLITSTADGWTGGLVGLASADMEIGDNVNITADIVAVNKVYLGGAVGRAYGDVKIGDNLSISLSRLHGFGSLGGAVGGAVISGTTSARVEIGDYAEITVNSLISSTAASALTGGVTGYAQSGLRIGDGAVIGIAPEGVRTTNTFGGIFGRVGTGLTHTAEIGSGLILDIGSITATGTAVGAIGGRAYGDVRIGARSKVTVDSVTGTDYIGGAGVGYVNGSLEIAGGVDNLQPLTAYNFKVKRVLGSTDIGGFSGRVEKDVRLGDNLVFAVGAVEATGGIAGGLFGSVDNDFSAGTGLTVTVDKIGNGVGNTYYGGVVGIDHRKYQSSSAYSADGMSAMTALMSNAEFRAANTVGAGLNVTVGEVLGGYYSGGFASQAVKFFEGGAFTAHVTGNTSGAHSIGGMFMNFLGEIHGMDIDTVVYGPAYGTSAGVAAYLRQGSMIDGCVINTTITGASALGGVAAAAYAGVTIGGEQGITVNANITGTSSLGGVVSTLYESGARIASSATVPSSVTAVINGTSSLAGVAVTTATGSIIGGEARLGVNATITGTSSLGGAAVELNGGAKNIDITAKLTGTNYMGGLSVRATNTNAGWTNAVASGYTNFTAFAADKISGITVKAGTSFVSTTSSGSGYIGGLVGQAVSLYVSGATVEAGVIFNTPSLGYLGGAFGYLGNGVTYNNFVENVTVAGASISTVQTYIGGFAGYLNRARIGKGNDITADLNVAASYAGGFAATAALNSVIDSDNSVAGTITTAHQTGTLNYVGGFIGVITTASRVLSGATAANGNSVDVVIRRGPTVSGAVSYAGLFAGQLLSDSAAGHFVIKPTSKLIDMSAYIGGAIGQMTGAGTTVGDPALRITVPADIVTSTLSAAGSYTGGFVGHMADGVIQNAEFTGSLTLDKSTQVGGFAAGFNRGLIINCAVSVKTVINLTTTVTHAGGFLGYSAPDYYTASRRDRTANFVNCGTAASIRADTTANSNFGGFAGNILRTGIGPGCYSTGDVSVTTHASAATVGGFVGNIADALPDAVDVNTLIDAGCYATGNVYTYRADDNGGYYAGGFAGNINVGGDIGAGCYSTGDVSGNPQYMGGFVGHSGGRIAANCYATGKINSTHTTSIVGGFVGHMNYGRINGTCKYTPPAGYVLRGYQAGGFAGRILFGGVITSSYYTAPTVDGSDNPELSSPLALGNDKAGTPVTLTGKYMVLDVPVDAIYDGGGFAAAVDLANISNIAVTAPVTGDSPQRGHYLGGVIGHISTNANTERYPLRITNIYASASAAVTAYGFTGVGGLIGYMLRNAEVYHDAGAELSYSAAYNAVSATVSTVSYVGGAVGSVTLAEIDNVKAYGAVYVDSRMVNLHSTVYVGGLIGYISDAKTNRPGNADHNRQAAVTSSHSYSNVETFGNIVNTGGFTGRNGGVIGDGCTAESTVIHGGLYSYSVSGGGGFAGSNGTTGSIGAYCTSLGDVTALGANGDAMGGFIGYNDGSIGVNCAYLGGTVTGYYAGGLIGRMFKLSIVAGTEAEPMVIGANIIVKGRYYAGGVVGSMAGGAIRYVVSSAKISIAATSGSCYIGGIVAYASAGVISDCTATSSAAIESTAAVNTSLYAGGIAGYLAFTSYNENTNDFLRNEAHNDITVINGTNVYAGGAVGVATKINMADSIATGKLTVLNYLGTVALGGFIGSSEANTSLRHSAATGDLLAQGTDYNAAGEFGIRNTGSLGGFAGYIYGSASDCASYGSVAGRIVYMGGFAGCINAANTRTANCASYGSVTVTGTISYAGGFAGAIGGTATGVANRVSGSVSYGDTVIAAGTTAGAGGFVGIVDQKGDLNENISFGSLVLRAGAAITSAGGFAGRGVVTSSIKSCYAFGFERYPGAPVFTANQDSFLGYSTYPDVLTGNYVNVAIGASNKPGVSTFTVAPLINDITVTDTVVLYTGSTAFGVHSISAPAVADVLGDTLTALAAGTSNVVLKLTIKLYDNTATATAGTQDYFVYASGAAPDLTDTATPLAARLVSAFDRGAFTRDFVFIVDGAAPPAEPVLGTDYTIDGIVLSSDNGDGLEYVTAAPEALTLTAAVSVTDIATGISPPSDAGSAVGWRFKVQKDLGASVTGIADFTSNPLFLPLDVMGQYFTAVSSAGTLAVTADMYLRFKIYVYAEAYSLYNGAVTQSFIFSIAPEASSYPAIVFYNSAVEDAQNEATPLYIFGNQIIDLDFEVTGANPGHTVSIAAVTGISDTSLSGHFLVCVNSTYRGEAFLRVTITAQALNQDGTPCVSYVYVRQLAQVYQMYIMPADAELAARYTANTFAVTAGRPIGYDIFMFWSTTTVGDGTLIYNGPIAAYAYVSVTASDPSVIITAADGDNGRIKTGELPADRENFTLTFTKAGVYTVTFTPADGARPFSRTYYVELPEPDASIIDTNGYTPGAWSDTDVTLSPAGVLPADVAALAGLTVQRYDEATDAWETFTSHVYGEGVYAAKFRYAQELAPGSYVYSLPFVLAVNVDKTVLTNPLPVNTVDTAAGKNVYVLPVASLSPVTYTYTVDGGSVTAVPANGIIAAAWNTTVVVTATNAAGSTVSATVTVGSEPIPPADDFAFTVSTLYAEGTWTALNVVFDFAPSRENVAVVFYYSLDGVIWTVVPYSSRSLTLSTTTDGVYRFRAVRGGVTYYENGAVDADSTATHAVKIDKSAMFTLALTKPAGYANINDPAAYLALGVSITGTFPSGFAVTVTGPSGGIPDPIPADTKIFTQNLYKNGAYTVTVTDGAGRTLSETFDVTGFRDIIDSSATVAAVSVQGDAGYFNEIRLRVETTPAVLPVVRWQVSTNGSTFTELALEDYPLYRVPANANYYFRLYDSLGNYATSAPKTVSNLDLSKPTLTINFDGEAWIQQGAPIGIIAGGYAPSGFDRLEVYKGLGSTPVKTYATPESIDTDPFTVDEAGKYTFILYNLAGSSVTKTIEVVKIDPSTHITLNTVVTGATDKWTHSPVTFNLSYTETTIQAPVYYEYSVNGGTTWNELSGSVLTISGNHEELSYRFRVSTTAGLRSDYEAAPDYAVRINEQAPVVNVRPTYSGSTVTFAVSSPNTVMPLDRWVIEYKIDNGLWTTWTASFTYGCKAYVEVFVFRIVLFGDDGSETDLIGESVNIPVVEDQVTPELNVVHDKGDGTAVTLPDFYGTIIFGLSNTVNGTGNVSGTYYEYSKDYYDLDTADGGALHSIDPATAQWVAVEGVSVGTSALAFELDFTINGWITFRSVSGTGTLTAQANYKSFSVKVDRTVTLTVTNQNPGVWSQVSNTFTLSPGTGGTYTGNISDFYVTLPDTSVFSLMSGGLPVNAYTAYANGTYIFTVVNKFGFGADEEFGLTVDHIDNASPVFDIITLNYTLGAWTDTPVSFVVSSPGVLSGADFYYRAVTGAGVSEAIVPFIKIVVAVGQTPSVTISGDQVNYYQFKAISGSGVIVYYDSGINNAYTGAGGYPSDGIGFQVKIDTDVPTIGVSAAGNPTGPGYVRMDSLSVTLTPHYTVSGGEVWVRVRGIESYVSDATAAFVYTITSNGNYEFFIKSGSGKTSVVSATEIVDATYIDFADPTFTVTSYNLNGGNWTYRSVYFVITPTATPASGITYSYSIDGTTWTTITSFTPTGTETAPAFTFYVDSLIGGTEGFNGTLYFKAAANSSGTADQTESYVVKVDKKTPDIDFTVPSAGVYIITASYNLEFEHTLGISGTAGTQLLIDRVIAGVSTRIFTGTAATTSLPITVNATYRFQLTTAAGVTVVKELVVGFMDNIAPEFTVTTFASAAGQPVVWTASDITFTITTAVAPTSGVLYEISLTGAAPFTAFSIAEGIPYYTTSGNIDTSYIVIRAFKGSDTSKTVPTQYATAYQAHVDKDTPNISAADSGAGWTTGSVSITVTYGYTVPAPTRPHAPTRVSVSSDAGNTWTPVTVFPHIVTQNGTYLFRADNDALAVSTATPVVISRIETADPLLSVTTDGVTTGWTSGTVKFTLSATEAAVLQAAGASGLIYEYRIVDNTASGWGVGWTVLSVATEPWGTTSADTVEFTTAQVNLAIYFRVSAGRYSTTGEAPDEKGSYSVRIDASAPTITAVDSGSGWTTGNVLITLTTSFGASGLTGSVIWVDSGSGFTTSFAVTASPMTYSVSANGTYTFKVVSATGIDGAALSAPVTVNRIDDDFAPSITVVNIGTVGAWTKDSVEFRFSSAASPYSGVTYQYNIQLSGGSYQGWLNMITLGALDSVIFSADVNMTIQFRAVSGRGVYSADTVSRVVKINTFTPVMNTPTYSDSVWSVGPTAVSLSANFGTVTNASENGVFQYSTDTTTWYPTSATHSVTENGTYYFRAKGANGLFSAPKQVIIAYIDHVPPVIDVTVSGGDYTNVSPAVWTDEDVVFTLGAVTATVSAVSYFYQTGTTGVWNDADAWTSDADGIITVGNTTPLYYRFKIVTQVGSSVSGTYLVAVDKELPTFTTEPFVVNADDWILLTKTIQFAMLFGVSVNDSASRIEISTNGTDWDVINPLATSAISYAVTANNVRYYFRGVNAAGGVTTGSHSVLVEKIESAEEPRLVTAVAGTTGAWTSGLVAFTLSAETGTVPASGVEFYYRAAAVGVDITVVAYTKFTGVAYVSYGDGSTNVKTQVQFKTVSVSGLETDESLVYTVLIDNTRPALTLTPDNQTAPYVNGNRVINVKTAAFGNSLDQAASIVEYSVDNGSWQYLGTAAAANLAAGLNLTVTANGSYRFRAVNAAGESSLVNAAATVVIANIEKTVPDIKVKVTGVTTGWTNGPVTFTLSTTASLIPPLSKVFYQYTIDGGVTWVNLDSNIADGIAVNSITFTGALASDGFAAYDNFTVKFRAVAGRDISEASPPATELADSYAVRIDTSKPEITVSPTSHAYLPAGSSVQLTFGVTHAAGYSAGNTSVVWYYSEANPTPQAAIGTANITFTQNGKYTFYVMSAAGAKSDNFTVDLNWIDSTSVAPQLTVQRNATTSAWTASDVAFTLTVDEVPASGVVYEYSEDNGVTWNAVPFDGGSTTTAVLRYTSSVNTEVIFRVYAGRDSADADVQSDYSTAYTVRVDKDIPVITPDNTAGDYAADGAGYILADWKYSGYVGIKLDILFGNAGKTASTVAVVFVSDKGGAPVTTNLTTQFADANYSYTYQATQNGVYTFEARNAAGTLAAFVVTIGKLDNVAPDFTVTTGYAGAWTKESVTYTVVTNVTPQSGVTYFYKLVWDSVYSVRNDGVDYDAWLPVLSSTVTISNTGYAFLGTIVFAAMKTSQAAGNKDALGVLSTPAALKLSNVAPSLTLSSILDSLGAGQWTNAAQVAVDITADFGVTSGAGSENQIWVRKLNGIEENITGRTFYNVYTNGVYEFRAISASNVATAWVSYEVTKMDNVTPNMSVTATGRLDAWTAASVTLVVSPVSVPASGIRYQYSVDGGVTWAAFDETAFALNPGIAVTSDIGANGVYYTLTITPTEGVSRWVFNETLQFRCYAVSAASDIDDKAVEYGTTFTVMIDSTLPVMTNADITGNATSFTNGDVELTPAATFAGGSGYRLMVEGNGIATQEVVGSFRAAVNGVYTFYALSGAGLSSAKIPVTVSKIDKKIPDIIVELVTGDAFGPTGRWTDKDVKFIIREGDSQSLPISGVSYEYRLGTVSGFGTVWDEWQAVVGLEQLFNDNMDRPVQFRALSGVDIEKLSSTYRVRIDKAAATVTVLGNPTAKVPANNIAEQKLTVVIDAGLSGYGSLTVSFDGGEAKPMIGTELAINENGTYLFTVVFNNGRIITESVYVNMLDPNGPEFDAHGVAANASVKINVTLDITDYVASSVRITLDGKEIKSSYNGAAVNSMTFTANGTYTVYVRDDAGNEAEFTFTIAKPNYVVIVGSSVGGLGLAALAAYLVIKYLRNKKAFQRLAASATASDEHNRFGLFKKAK